MLAISPFLKKPWLTMYPARFRSPLSNSRIDALMCARSCRACAIPAIAPVISARFRFKL